MSTRPALSVVVETETAQIADEAIDVARLRLTRVFGAVRDQARDAAGLELLLAVDPVSPVAEWMRTAHPDVRLVPVTGTNQFRQKNQGLLAATGDLVALIDADCTPEPGWVSAILGSMSTGAAAVAGRTVYERDTLWWRLLTSFDFGHVHQGADGNATALLSNNAAFRRDALGGGLFDERVDRFSACYHLGRRMRASGQRIAYAPAMVARHALADADGVRAFTKHVHRGFDNAALIRADRSGLLAPAWVSRLGPVVPVAMGATRMLYDARRFGFERTRIGLKRRDMPLYAAMSIGLRTCEVLGGWLSMVRPNFYRT